MNEDAPQGFQCNICGTRNGTLPDPADREVASCRGCGSTIRTRSVMQVLSEHLFGTTIPVRDFPKLKGIRGIGMSDSPDYAPLLADRFDYKNTWFDQEPRFDATDVPDSEFGRYDFVVSSEVLEHIAPPVERAFRSLSRVLKPNGVLILTTPFGPHEKTREHYPALHEFAVVSLGEKLVLVNRTRGGEIEVHENLVFHGGPGATLEMRLFAEKHLRDGLRYAGFEAIEFYPGPAREWGIVQQGWWSLPIAARKGAFGLRREVAAEWGNDWRRALERVRRQDDELKGFREAFSRLEELENMVVERSDWARKLEGELEAARARIQELDQELATRTDWAQGLDRELKEKNEYVRHLQRELEELNASRAVRVGKKLGL